MAADMAGVTVAAVIGGKQPVEARQRPWVGAPERVCSSAFINYRAHMAKIHGNSGTATQLEVDANTAKAKASQAKNRQAELRQLLKGIEQRIAQLQGQVNPSKPKPKRGKKS